MKKKIILALVLLFSTSSVFAMKGFNSKEALFSAVMKYCVPMEKNYKNVSLSQKRIRQYGKQLAPYVFNKHKKTGKKEYSRAIRIINHCAMYANKDRKNLKWTIKDFTVSPKITGLSRSIGSASYYKRLSYTFFAKQPKHLSYQLIVIPVRMNGVVKWFLG